MALIVSKADGTNFIINGTDFEVPSIYVFVTAYFQGKNSLINGIPFLSKNFKDKKQPLNNISLPKKGRLPQGMLFECNEQSITEAHNLLKNFYEENGLVVDIVDL